MSIESRSRADSSAHGTQRYARTIYSVPLTVRCSTTHGIETWHGISLDISEGGLGALICGHLEPGEAVALELQLPGRLLNLVPSRATLPMIAQDSNFWG